MDTYHGSSLSHFCLAERQLKQAVACREAVAVDAIVARSDIRLGVILEPTLWTFVCQVTYLLVCDLTVMTERDGMLFCEFESA